MQVDHRENVQNAVGAVGKHAALILSDEEADAAVVAVIEGLMEPSEEALESGRSTPGMQACDGLITIAFVHGAKLGMEHSPPNSPMEQSWRAMLTAELARLKKEREG